MMYRAAQIAALSLAALAITTSAWTQGTASGDPISSSPQVAPVEARPGAPDGQAGQQERAPAMSAKDAKQIVEIVARFDSQPPSQDYSERDFGAGVGRTIDAATAPLLVTESFKALPASLVEPFLEGVLDHVSVPNLNEVLLAVLPEADDVSSGAVIVRFLLLRTQMPRLAIITRLISQIESAGNFQPQANIAFAIWTMLGDTPADPHASPQDKAEYRKIQVLLEGLLKERSPVVLTDYARGLLQRCRR